MTEEPKVVEVEVLPFRIPEPPVLKVQRLTLEEIQEKYGRD